MNGRATTTVQVLRGTTTDTYGDEADNGTVVASGVPVSIVESRQEAKASQSGMPRVVRTHVGRTRGDRDIRPGDQLQDERSSRKFIVDSTARPDSPIRKNDLVLDLRRVT